MSSFTDCGRRNFLKGRRTEQFISRPPWALSELDFVNQCERCDQCVQACEEKIIVKGDGSFPEVNFDHSECTFCEACLNACPTGSLDKAKTERAFPHVAAIEETCLSKQRIVCQACRDVCEVKAIGLQWQSSVPIPVIDENICTGCGACASVCPSQSINFKKV